MCPVFKGKYCILCFLCLLLPSPGKSGKGQQPGPSSASNAEQWKNHTNITDSFQIGGDRDPPLDPPSNASVYYLRMLFDKYGHEDMLTLDSFKLLLYSLGLRPLQNDTDLLVTTDLPVVAEDDRHQIEQPPGGASSENSTTDDPQQGLSSSNTGRNGEEEKKTNNPNPENPEKILNRLRREATPPKCLSASDYLAAFQFNIDGSLTIQQFLGLCPALIQQLDSQACPSPVHPPHHHHHHDSDSQQVLSSSHEHFDHNHTDHNHTHEEHDHDHHDHDHDHKNKKTCGRQYHDSIPAAVWLWSSLAVVGISVVGLLGVIVIPFMQKVFYNHLLQCLVAVAIGALSGDALLHLLPHALSNDHAHELCPDELGGTPKHDKTSILKGLVGLMGILIFFVIERVITIFTLMRTDKRKKRKRNCAQVATISEGETDTAAKLSSHRSRNSHYQSCEDVVMMVHPNRALKDLAEDSHADLIECSHQQVHQSDEEHTTMMSPSHNNHTNHDHSHFYQPHGHSHFPCLDSDGHNIPAMAWIVVIGDGIHNLCDGLAIGAAFGYSNTIGCSTAIAVLCHELPHEIGDFAVLLRAGMSLRKAIIYNIVSSVLCLVGMIIGVLLGNISSVTEWIFAAVGGVFLYIALVDMLPEISSVETREGEHPFFHLFIQCLGLLIGAGIMWLIAYYEHDLINAL